MMPTKKILSSFQNNSKRYLKHLLHLVYPNLCLCCDRELPNSSEHLCFVCLEELHFTLFDQFEFESPADKLFWGRIQITKVFPLLYYKNNTQSQRILHSLKYDNQPDLAFYMGELIGKKIKESEFLKTIDLLIPVPIHEKKKYIRGYNQSEEIANGISSITNIASPNDYLKRILHTVSQTKKGKFERWENVQEAFILAKDFPDDIKHIALVDDVITTGSTLETIVRVIKEKKDLEISIISIAYAGR